MTEALPLARAHASIRRHMAVILSAVALLAAVAGGGAATTELAGAVVANGVLVVESQLKKVQHPTGGVVSELRVREGDRVRAGDILLRLDPTQIRAGLAIVSKALDELAARQARDEAERDGANVVPFPADLSARASRDAAAAAVMAGESRLFETRRLARDGQKAQLREQIEQLKSQITGLVDQEASKAKEMQWVAQELRGVRDLWEKKLVQFARVTSLERESVRLGGERGVLVASIAQARGRIAEIELRIIQLDEDLRTEVGKDLADIRSRSSELIERQIAAVDQLKKIDIRAPASGRVHQLTVHNVGGVILPQADPIMYIVPDSDALAVELRVQPQDIDQVHPGQQARVRFAAFDQRTTPELTGDVSLVAADTSADPRSGANYYLVRLHLDPEEIARLDGAKLIPGMPVEAFIQTSSRTIASYLLKPMSDQIRKAFREK